MKLIPAVQNYNETSDKFNITYRTRIVLENTSASATLFAQMLQAAVEEELGLTLDIKRGVPKTGDIRLVIDEAVEDNHYTLVVNNESLTVSAASETLLLNGVQTAIQLVQRDGFNQIGVEIEDWADLRDRGYYFDVSRGRVPTLETLKKQVDLLVRYKLNQFQLYIEHTFLFEELSEAWRDETPLTAEDILELDKYCLDRHVELVPSLSTFGHMYKILSTKTYEELCELEDSSSDAFTYTFAGNRHTIKSSQESIDFVTSLIDEYSALFTSDKFNICGDETFDLGLGRSKELVEEHGKQRIYMEHIKALCEHLVAQGKTPMFWGDIVLRFPEAVKELPEETICLAWGYLWNQREEEVKGIADQGAKTYACPGVGSWNMIVPIYWSAYENIARMSQYAVNNGSLGVLNTDWGDYGHVNDPRLSFPGVIYGAALSWKVDKVPFEEINAAISYLEYGDKTETFMEGLFQLSGNDVFAWDKMVRWGEAADQEAADKEFNEIDFNRIPKSRERLASGLEIIQNSDISKQKDLCSLAQVLSTGIELWNEIGIWIGHNEYDGSKVAEFEARDAVDLATELEHWWRAYKREWYKTSQVSTLPRLEKLIFSYADMLRGREIRPSESVQY